MKRFNLQKIMIVWLLLAIFIFPDVIKSFHMPHCGCHNEVCETKKEKKQREHDCETCLICHFSFYSFLPSEEIKLTESFSEYFSTQFYNEQEHYVSSVNSCYKRGPPCI
ncbi:MAG: hypothetical protein LIO65_00760 [Odoribacter sp.]|nr:hypothetical protein [Odoribacter sp.]